MRYMVTIYNNDATLQAIEGSDREEFERVHRTVQEELRASGELVATHELSDVEACVVLDRAGERIVTDGPLTRVGDFAGGYYLIDCVDIERAAE
ncbi:MAG: hypothetical protein HIU86_13640, partial [Acidobacteria bacterium]|nr:hypothetical protein [Acidobacteriota bacterium]